MASRRMFSKDVVCSDRFLDMPASAQALYFQYGLEADDDGFVSAPKKILRLTNASDDDLKILVAKGFLIPFDSGVVVIRDWKINNYLRRDRYTPTRFKEEFEQLDTIDDRYQLHVLAVGIPDDNHVVDMRDTQVRLGKDSIGKGSINNNVGRKMSHFTPPTVEEVQDYLSPLDDLNKFTAEDTTSKASSGNSGSSGGGVDPGQMFEDVPIESNIEKIFQKIKDLIKSGDFEGLGEMMADAINRGLKKVKKAISWDNVGPTVTYFVTAFTRTFNSLVDNIDWDLLGRTIGTGINTIVNTLDLFYTGIDWKNLGSKFAEGVNGVVYEVDWAKLGQFIGHKLLALPTVIVGFIENLDWSALSKAASTLVLNFLDTLIEFIHNIDWSKIVTNIQDALTNIQWIAIAEKILELLGYALGSITGALARLIGNLIAQGASEAYQYFEDKIKEAGGNVVDGILLGILDALLGIGSWIVDNVFKPILDGFKNAFGIHSPSTVMQEQGHYIIEGLLLGITDFLSKIKKKFEEIRNLVTEKMDNIKSSAVSKVNEMKKGLSDGVERIKESFRSGFSTLVGYVKSPINSIIRFINNFLYAIQTMQNSFANALNSMSISLPHWLEKLTGFSSVGFNVGYWSAPMVPYLAQGAVIPPNKEFMAVLGDQKSGNNIEAPESLIRRIVREESGNGKGSTYNVTAQVNRRTLFDLVLEEGKVRRTVTGRNPFETV